MPTFNTKITQLYETLVVRHGVMLVGPTGSGKTVNRDVMKGALTWLRERNSENSFAQVRALHPPSEWPHLSPPPPRPPIPPPISKDGRQRHSTLCSQ